MSPTSGGFFGRNPEEVNYNQMMDSFISQSPTNSLNSPRISGPADMLFLKRLLYLKASIDTDQTIQTYSVPLE